MKVKTFLETLKISRIFKNLFFFLAGAFMAVFVLLILIVFFLLGSKKEYESRVYPGVYLGVVSLSGKNQVEVTELLASQQEDLASQKMVLVWRQGENKSWEVTPATIDFILDEIEISKQVFLLGRKESGLAGLEELTRLMLFSQKVEPKYNFNQDKLEALTASMSATIDEPVQEGLFEFKDGKVTAFQPSVTGRQLEKEKVKDLILMAFSQGGVEDEPLVFDLPVTDLIPKVATQTTNNLGIKEFLAVGESFFYDSIPSRIYNIGLATSHLHGQVLAPGETFSFAQKIGTVSAATGYQQAYVIKEKQTILEDGGGVCQVSTTLFRAALNAGLPILERQPHYYRVSFYEQGGYPPGLDATVYPPSPDLKFKNDTPAYILIQASFDKGTKRLAFTLYGTNDGRKTEVAKPIIHSRTEPPEPTYIDDPALAVGVVKQTDQAHWGAKVSFTRKVWDASGQLKEEREFWSNYTAWPAVYLRGTKVP